MTIAVKRQGPTSQLCDIMLVEMNMVGVAADACYVAQFPEFSPEDGSAWGRNC